MWIVGAPVRLRRCRFVAMAVTPGRHPLAGPEPFFCRRWQSAGFASHGRGVALTSSASIAVRPLAEGKPKTRNRHPAPSSPRSYAGLRCSPLVFSQLRSSAVSPQDGVGGHRSDALAAEWQVPRRFLHCCLRRRRRRFGAKFCRPSVVSGFTAWAGDLILLRRACSAALERF